MQCFASAADIVLLAPSDMRLDVVVVVGLEAFGFGQIRELDFRSSTVAALESYSVGPETK